jgi:diaminopimelate decarboxylase
LPLAAGQGVDKEKQVSVTLSGFLSSVLSEYAPRVQRADRGADGMHSPPVEQEDLQRCKIYRKSFPMTEIAIPAIVLRNRAVAKWVTDHRVTVDVHSGEDLAVAIAAGVHLSRLTLHADVLSESDLFAAIRLGIGRIVVGSVGQIDLLRSVVVQRAQDIIVRMTDINFPVLAMADGVDRVPFGFRFDSNEADIAIAAILDHEWLDLVGLHCDVGLQDHDFVSYPAAIGHMVAEMAQVRRTHGIVLARLGLGGGRAVPTGDWAVELPKLAGQIDDALDDSCATLRYPRPLVVLSPGLAIVGQRAA